MMDSAFEAMERAKRQNSGGNPAGAAKTLENYLARDPENHKARILLANIYIYSLNEFDFGIFQLDAVLERDPENFECLKAKATALSSYKKYNKETDEIFQRIVDNEPSAEVCSAYGRFLRMQMLDFRKSAEYFLKAIELEPNDVDHRINYTAVLLNDLREYVKAKKELEIIIQLDPENYSAQKNLTKLLKYHFDKDGNLKKGFSHRPKKR
jgi:Tfp pilus assembly protein PilF